MTMRIRGSAGHWIKGRGMDERYMTVGEVADLVGVTVRSIQYYDQQGVLSPSAKGPQNQRLYTREDVRRLYQILCLKYAGLSLSRIKEIMGAPSLPDVPLGAAEMTFARAMRETEDGFSTLLRRYATLKGLAQTVTAAAAEGVEPDWQAMAQSIDSKQGEGRFFWRLSCIYDEEGEVSEGLSESQSEEKHDLIAAWHGLMAEAVSLMRHREPLDSPRSREVARKVLELRAEDARLSEGQGFLMLGNVPEAPHAGNASFDDLRQEMDAYLERLVEAYLDGMAEGTAQGEFATGAELAAGESAPRGSQSASRAESAGEVRA